MLLFLTMIDSDEDKSKFEVIYENYRNLMFFVAKKILYSDSDAEDAVQDAFIRIINNLDKIEDPKCHKTKNLIVIITKRIAIDIYRSKSKYITVSETDELDLNELNNVSSGSEFDKVDENIDISYAISKLPDRYRDVLLLKYYNDYTDSEIAEILTTSEANVRKLLERSRKKLGNMLGEDGYNS